IITMVAAIFTIMLAGATGIHAQGDCGCLPPSGKDIANGDSIVIDTCGLQGAWTDCEEAAHYAGLLRMYARHWWFIHFDVDAIHLPAADPNAIIEVGWQAIDTAYLDTREGFEALERRLGPITLRKVYPQATTGEDARMFRMRLEQYFYQDSVTRETDSIPHVVCDFASSITFPSSVVHIDQSIANNYIEVKPNPAHDRVNVCCGHSDAWVPLMVADVAGHIVIASEARTDASGNALIDVSRLEPGLYLIHCGSVSGSFLVAR
nr:T9SS type A sorting domain-containing protein [Candidatus Kapabacteria bacterium]